MEQDIDKQMKEVTYRDFITTIANDFSIQVKKEYSLKLPSDKKSIKRFIASVANEVRIFDGSNEYPYMLEKSRNEEKLKIGIELRHRDYKTLSDILTESGANIKSKGCRICEGGGWSSQGTRYTYKNIYCEV